MMIPSLLFRVIAASSSFHILLATAFSAPHAAVSPVVSSSSISSSHVTTAEPITTTPIESDSQSSSTTTTTISESSSSSSSTIDKTLRRHNLVENHQLPDKEELLYDPMAGAHAPLRRNHRDEVWVPQRARPRRNRKSAVMRSMVREHRLHPSDFIYPLFIHDEESNHDIPSMPGCVRHSLSSMLQEVGEASRVGVKSFVLFPKIPNALKSNLAEQAYDPTGLVPRAVGLLKQTYPECMVCTDVALDPYSDQGHDGVVDIETGTILNDVTIHQLCQQAVCHAHAGADVVAPSDMMDGRVKAIRDALDAEGYTDVSILSYTAKYASAFYGPFRDALDSHPGFGDKKTYQQDPAGSSREALLEAALDAAEGTDMLMVKPGMPYLDIITRLRDSTSHHLPIAAYQVSGEYAMLKAAAAHGWLNEKDVVLESLVCFKRAGANMILTYYAKQAALWLQQREEEEEQQNNNNDKE